VKITTLKIKKILVPIDFSDTSLKALDYAADMVKRSGASITLIHNTASMIVNISPGEYYAPQVYNLAGHEKEVREKAKKHLEKIAKKLEREFGIKITAATTSGWVREQILQTADKIKADLIIMGTHGVKGFREFLVGSNTFRVVNESKCPVLSVQHYSKNTQFKNILLPFRDKPHSREKVDFGIRIAELYEAKLHILGIDTAQSKLSYKKILLEAEQIKQIAEKREITSNIKIFSKGYTSDLILSQAKKIKADLIIIMSDLDRSRISQLIMGPICQQIVNHSPIPVLSIPPTFNPKALQDFSLWQS